MYGQINLIDLNVDFDVSFDIYNIDKISYIYLGSLIGYVVSPIILLIRN